MRKSNYLHSPNDVLIFCSLPQGLGRWLKTRLQDEDRSQTVHACRKKASSRIQTKIRRASAQLRFSFRCVLIVAFSHLSYFLYSQKRRCSRIMMTIAVVVVAAAAIVAAATTAAVMTMMTIIIIRALASILQSLASEMSTCAGYFQRQARRTSGGRL